MNRSTLVQNAWILTHSIGRQTATLQSSSSSQWEVPIELGNGTTTKRSGPMNNKKKTHTHTHTLDLLTDKVGCSQVDLMLNHLLMRSVCSSSSRIVGGYYDKSNNYWGGEGEEKESAACAEYLVVVVVMGEWNHQRVGGAAAVVAGQLINKKNLLSWQTHFGRKESSQVF